MALCCRNIHDFMVQTFPWIKGKSVNFPWMTQPLSETYSDILNWCDYTPNMSSQAACGGIDIREWLLEIWYPHGPFTCEGWTADMVGVPMMVRRLNAVRVSGYQCVDTHGMYKRYLAAYAVNPSL